MRRALFIFYVDFHEWAGFHNIVDRVVHVGSDAIRKFLHRVKIQSFSTPHNTVKQWLHLPEWVSTCNRITDSHRVFFEHIYISHHDIRPLNIVQSTDAISCFVGDAWAIWWAVLEHVFQSVFLLLQIVDFSISCDLHMIERL